MNTQQKTVLIIEDEQDMLIALREQLGGEGFSVLQARDGAEGLRLASRNILTIRKFFNYKC